MSEVINMLHDGKVNEEGVIIFKHDRTNWVDSLVSAHQKMAGKSILSICDLNKKMELVVTLDGKEYLRDDIHKIIDDVSEVKLREAKESIGFDNIQHHINEEVTRLSAERFEDVKDKFERMMNDMRNMFQSFIDDNERNEDWR